MMDVYTSLLTTISRKLLGCCLQNDDKSVGWVWDITALFVHFGAQEGDTV